MAMRFDEIFLQYAKKDSESAPALVASRVNVLKQFCFTPASFAYIQSQATDSHQKPFQGDSDFVQAKERYFGLVCWTNSVDNFAVPNALQKLIEADKLSLALATECLHEILRYFEEYIEQRVAKTDPVPRALRVCQRLKLSAVETEAILFILILQCGSIPFRQSQVENSPPNIARFAKMTPKQLCAFLSDSRDHVKQGLIGFGDTTRTKGMLQDQKITMPQEAVAAFSGVDLTEEQLFKLDKTALSQELLQERGEEGMPNLQTTSTADLAEKDENDDDDDDDESGTGDEESSEEEEGGKKDLEESPGIGEKRKRKQGASLLAAMKRSTTGESMVSVDDEASLLHTPYTTNIGYNDDYFKLLSNMVKIRYAEGEIKDDEEAVYLTPKNKVEAQLRELKGRQRLLKAKLNSRLAATKKAGAWLPRVEQVAQELKLSQFEKELLLLLVGNVVSHDLLVAINGRYVMREGGRELTVGLVLFILCEGLQSRVTARTSFNRSAPLLEHGLISISIGTGGRSNFNTDLMDYMVDIDRKIVDDLMGLHTNTDEMVQGSKLYVPTVKLTNVILPKDTKKSVLSTIEHYELFNQCKKKFGFGEGLGSQIGGLVFLFFGPSGTGKTMLANAITADLKKKLLLVTFAQFKGDKGPEILRFIFREAKLNDAIVFFDECETIFESRESNSMVTSLLAEFERYEGMIILATNRAQIMDEAMNRRISLCVEFKLPDHQMREAIWRAHVTDQIPLDPSVSLQRLAMDYELSGGLIRNAALAALSLAVAREKTDTPTLVMSDLEEGAKMQLRGFFQAASQPLGGSSSASPYVTPKRGLSSVIVEDSVKKKLDNIVRLAKSRNTLFAQWGFEESECTDQGSLVLCVGHSGTGKSLAAEAIAYECGATMRIANVPELLLTREAAVKQIFDEAQKLGAVVIFDAAEQLFNYTDKSIGVAELIQYHALRYSKPVLVLATIGIPGSSFPSSIDIRSTKLKFNHEVHFQLPGKKLREELWRKSLPPAVPVAKDIDFAILSERRVSAKFIRSVAFGACAKVSLLPVEERMVRQQHLIDECEELANKERQGNFQSSMYV